MKTGGLEQPGIWSLPASVRAAALLAFGFVCLIVWDQSYWWIRREDYSFGWLVPLFAGWVLFERWETIRDHWLGEGAPEAGPGDSRLAFWFWGGCFGAAYFLGLAGIFFGATLRATQGVQHSASLTLAWGFGWWMLATAYWLSAEDARGGRYPLRRRLRMTALFLFPAFIWMLSAPLLSFVERGISLYLLGQVTAVVFFLFDLAGIPIQKDGNILILGYLESGQRNQVMVEDACSGIRSLMACLFAGSFIGAVFLNRFWKKVLLVVIAMGFAFFNNILRSLFLTYWAFRHGSDAILGAVHDWTGYGILALTSIGLLALVPLLNYRVEWDEVDELPLERT